MRKTLSLLTVLTCGAFFNLYAQDSFMEPATVLDPVSETYLTPPQDVWVSWDNRPIFFTSPETDFNGDSYANVSVTLDDLPALEVPAFIMYVEGDGQNFKDQWMLDIALYESSEVTSFGGNRISIGIPEGIVKDNSGALNAAQTIIFTKSELADAPVFFDITWSPEDGSKMENDNAVVTIGFGGNKIEYLSGSVNLLSFKTWKDYALEFGKEVTISGGTELLIDLSGFEPAEYEIQIPDALVKVDVDGVTHISASIWLDYTLIPGSGNTDNPSEPQSPITEVSGSTRLYDKECYGTFVLGGVMDQYTENFPATVVWGENNEVYVKDILSLVACDTYVKGTYADNYITFDADQLIDYYPEEGYGISVGVLKTEVKGDQVYFNYDPSVKTFGMIVGEDGSLTLDLPGAPFDGENVPEYVLGIYYNDDKEFIGYSDYSQKYEPTAYDMVTMPAGAELLPYVFIDEYNYASLVDVAFDNDKLYIRGLNPMLPEATVMARIEGDKAYISQDEFLGVYMDMWFIFTKVLYENPDFNEEDPDSMPYTMAPSDVRFELNIDRESGTISAETPQVYLAFMSDEDFFSLTYMLGMFTLIYQDSPAGTPSNPTGLEYSTEYADRQGFNDFWFLLSNFSTEGKLLDTETLYYRVFLDGEPLIFEQEVIIDLMNQEVTAYEYVPDQQIYLPYNFNNGNDIYKFADNLFDIGIYIEGLSTVGVQSMYVYAGEVTYSDVVTLDIQTGEITTGDAGVETVNDSPVVATEYYDLSGLRVQHPERGLYIVRQHHADGSVTSAKLLKR